MVVAGLALCVLTSGLAGHTSRNGYVTDEVKHVQNTQVAGATVVYCHSQKQVRSVWSHQLVWRYHSGGGSA